MIAAFLALAFEALAVFLLARGLSGSALAAHVASAGLLAEAFLAGAPARPRHAIARAWFWAAAFPGLGAFAAVFLLSSRKRGGGERGESREKLRAKSQAAALAGRSRAQEVGLDLVPLVDALADPDASVRVAAVDALRGQGTKWAVQLLRHARDNDVYDVRFRAVEELGRVNSARLDAIAEARTALERAPSPEAHGRLALACFEYADLGLDSAEVSRSYLQQAIAHGRRALAADGTPRSDSVPSLMRLALLGLAQLQLEKRDFAGLRTTRARLNAVGVDAALAESLDYWCDEGAWSRPTSA